MVTRRSFLVGGGAALSLVALPARLHAREATHRIASPFRVAVITDEISQDFDHACSVAALDFGMRWVELRSMWNKTIHTLTSAEIEEARRILQKYDLRVTDIGSPLFKVDWPGAPLSKARAAKLGASAAKENADATFEEQDELLERTIELARIFQTDRIRGFDFWRLDDPTPYRTAINAKLADTAEKMSKHGLTFVLENEMACNTGTGAEAAKVLAAIPASNLMLNWDPGNAAALGETPFPNGWDLLPKNRIGHCHCKDTLPKPGGGFEWAPVGKGIIDWVGQFRALKRAGYHRAVSLETHWHGGNSREDSSRQSWAGMTSALQAAGAMA